MAKYIVVKDFVDARIMRGTPRKRGEAYPPAECVKVPPNWLEVLSGIATKDPVLNERWLPDGPYIEQVLDETKKLRTEAEIRAALTGGKVSTKAPDNAPPVAPINPSAEDIINKVANGSGSFGAVADEINFWKEKLQAIGVVGAHLIKKVETAQAKYKEAAGEAKFNEALAELASK